MDRRAITLGAALMLAVGCSTAVPTAPTPSPAMPSESTPPPTRTLAPATTPRPSTAAAPSPTVTAPPPTPTPTPPAQRLGRVVISDSGCSLEGVPGDVPPGRVAFDVANETAGRAGVHFWRITDGHTFDDVATLVQQAYEDALAGRSPANHPGWLTGLIPKEVSSGDAASAAGTAEPGVHAFICAKSFPIIGLAPYSVIGPIQIGAATAGTVTLSADGCSFTHSGAEPVAGKLSIEAVNATDGRFDLDLWRIDDGHAYRELAAHIAEEMRRWESDEPPLGHPTFASLVGEISVAAGSSGQVVKSLDRGVYGMACILFATPAAPSAIWSAGPLIVAQPAATPVAAGDKGFRG